MVLREVVAKEVIEGFGGDAIRGLIKGIREGASQYKNMMYWSGVFLLCFTEVSPAM